MIRKASEMRAEARSLLSGKWGGAVVLTLVYVAVAGILPSVFQLCTVQAVGTVVGLALLPVEYSYKVAFLDNCRGGGEYKVEQLLSCFRDYTRILGTLLLVGVYTFLWSLLLLIPGIVKSYSYSMTPFILRDNPELQYNDAINRSMAMMKGHKFDLFYLQLTFIGWALLALLTLGIGFLWLSPYVSAATVGFYEDVKAEYEEKMCGGTCL